MNEEDLCALANELLTLIKKEGKARTPNTRAWIREKVVLNPEFKSLALTIILLWEACIEKDLLDEL